MASREDRPGAKKPAPRKKAAGGSVKKAISRRPKAAEVGAPVDVVFDHVATRAYFLWQNGADGDQTAHWLQAERELATA